MAEAIKKATVGNPVFWVSFALCAGLIIAGFIVPPMGVVDGSVLTAVGELFAFPTLWTVWHAIDRGIDAKMKIGKAVVTLGDFNNESETSETEDDDTTT